MKNKIKSLIGAPLSIAQTFATGMLSFAGVLLLTSSWAWGIATFVFFAAIEGEVIHQNTVNGIADYLKGPILTIKRKIAAREIENMLLLEKLFTLDLDTLKKLFKKKKFTTILNSFREDVNPHIKNFLQFYFSNKQFIRKAKKVDEHAEDDNEVIASRSTLHEMEDFFIHCTTQTRDKDYQSTLEIAFRDLVSGDSIRIQREIRIKTIVATACTICAIGAGLGQTLVTLSATQAAFLALGFGTAATSFTVIGPIAIIAAVGYGIMMYHNLLDMVQNDTLQKWARKTKEFFKRRTDDKGIQESKTRYVARCTLAALVVGIVVGLGVFATAATAGTWWVAGKQGAKLLGWMSDKVTAIACSLSMFFMAPSLGSFNVTNSLKTTENLFGKIKRSYRNYMQKHAKHDNIEFHNSNKSLKEKSWRQLFQEANPFQKLYNGLGFVIRSGLYVFHCASVGFTGSQMPKVDPITSVVANAGSEFFQDYNYIEPHDHKHHHHDHDHAEHKCENMAHDAECDEDQEDEEEEGCSHSHTDLSGVILKVVAFPIRVLAKLWNWSFKDRSPKSIENLPKKEEVVEIAKLKAPATGNEWLTQVVIERCMERASTLDSEKNLLLSDTDKSTKSDAFKSIASELAKPETESIEVIYEPIKITADFSKHRNILLNSSSPTKSQKVIDDLNDERFDPIRVRLPQLISTSTAYRPMRHR